MTSRDLFEKLGTYGSELPRWPDSRSEARAALLADRDFRAAYDHERSLDRRLAAERDALDREMSRSGALDRIRRGALAQVPANVLAGMPWRRIAAAVLVAGMLGGALDMLRQAADEPIEVAISDPLYSLSAESE